MPIVWLCAGVGGFDFQERSCLRVTSPSRFLLIVQSLALPHSCFVLDCQWTPGGASVTAVVPGLYLISCGFFSALPFVATVSKTQKTHVCPVLRQLAQPDDHEVSATDDTVKSDVPELSLKRRICVQEETSIYNTSTCCGCCVVRLARLCHGPAKWEAFSNADQLASRSSGEWRSRLAPPPLARSDWPCPAVLLCCCSIVATSNSSRHRLLGSFVRRR